jgi:hypothetical protein
MPILQLAGLWLALGARVYRGFHRHIQNLLPNFDIRAFATLSIEDYSIPSP